MSTELEQILARDGFSESELLMLWLQGYAVPARFPLARGVAKRAVDHWRQEVLDEWRHRIRPPVSEMVSYRPDKTRKEHVSVGDGRSRCAAA